MYCHYNYYGISSVKMQLDFFIIFHFYFNLLQFICYGAERQRTKISVLFCFLSIKKFTLLKKCTSFWRKNELVISFLILVFYDKILPIMNNCLILKEIVPPCTLCNGVWLIIEIFLWCNGVNFIVEIST